MTTIHAFPFGITKSGNAVTRYLLEDGPLSVSILDYGGTVQALTVPDRTGKPADIVLGMDTVRGYEVQDKFLGALVGRCANRIARGRFSLHGRDYVLRCNDGPNHLHGGLGFDKRMWQAAPTGSSLELRLHSADGDEGYPGNLDIQVTYTLENGALTLDYRAKSDADTICNLTNHTYFNLSGHGSGSVASQYIRLFAECYTPADALSIPTGAVDSVANTPMDLRLPQIIGSNIDCDFDQLRFADGFDHNWVIDGAPNRLRPAAEAYSPETGIRMRTETTMPGIQFYSGNHLDGCPVGKGGAMYGKRCGFCLETQFPPDAIHHPSFPQPVLHAGEVYLQQTVYRFYQDG